MPNNNDVVWIELDRKRELRFGHKALKRMLALGEASVEELEDGTEMSQVEQLEQIEEILFFGLQKDAKDNDETLTLDMMEDLIDAADYDHILEKIEEAFAKGMGKRTGNAQVPKNRATRRAQK
ncbi:hypothetical protein BK133_11180 [Paenibacillus sp. FSL H8-0548]|uniref:hypothetical protein n=1 Tax=Paenibacillus sp. FSL H8-0548 TaxID=1920422 RepID=UPI00096C6D90|nr:hypothetical protein [Paenibacillus sp. FSL H8-0548]OMF35262.1 hypothetical protein BK133_11180 [Paenibacillus sp. FSL H8-0548]